MVDETQEILRHPGEPEPGMVRANRTPTIVAVVALVLGLAGLGIASGALASARKAGPTGPAGVTGPAGSTGPQGPAGNAGAAGTPGTLKATEVVSPTAVSSAPDPAVGTGLEATTSCPAGTVLFGGGADVTVAGGTDPHVALRSSYPLTTTAWRTVAVVTKPLAAGQTMTMKPYVLCGAASTGTTSTTAP